MQLFEETVTTQSIFKGHVISLEILQVKLPDGSTSEREIIRHSGAVCAAVIDQQQRFILVQQYRKGPEQVLTEIPAGKIDRGEDPDAAIWRELQEEIGIVSGNLSKLCSFFTAPGFCDELLHGYLVTDAVLGSNKLDQGEFLNVCSFSLDEIKQKLQSSEFNDAKTQVVLWNAIAKLGL